MRLDGSQRREDGSAPTFVRCESEEVNAVLAENIVALRHDSSHARPAFDEIKRVLRFLDSDYFSKTFFMSPTFF